MIWCINCTKMAEIIDFFKNFLHTLNFKPLLGPIIGPGVI